MANIKDAPSMTKISLILSSVGLLLHIIGFATTNWYVQHGTYHKGLWSECWGSYCQNYFYKSGSFRAVDAFETIGLILAILAVGAFLYWSFMDDVPLQSSLNIAIMAGLGSAALSIFIGDIIFGVSVIPYGYWGSSSFVLSIVGGVGLAVGAILEAVQLNSNTCEEDNERQPLRNNDANQPQQQNPNCTQEGSPSNQATNGNTFSASAGYPELKKEFPPNPSYYTDEKKVALQ